MSVKQNWLILSIATFSPGIIYAAAPVVFCSFLCISVDNPCCFIFRFVSILLYSKQATNPLYSSPVLSSIIILSLGTASFINSSKIISFFLLSFCCSFFLVFSLVFPTSSNKRAILSLHNKQPQCLQCHNWEISF